LATKIGEGKGKKNPIEAIGYKNRWEEGKKESNKGYWLQKSVRGREKRIQ
jgi:hypothetical protein